MLLAFFKTDPTTTPWFLRPATSGAAPTVTLSANHTSGASGLVVQFTASARAAGSNSISQYAWTFDDGDFAFGATPTKIFYVPGIYVVHLAVSDSAGNVTLKSIIITISGGTGGQTQLSLATIAEPTTTTVLVASSPVPSNDAFWIRTTADWSTPNPNREQPVVPTALAISRSATAMSGASSSRSQCVGFE
jgi:PKD repeat protein